MHKKWSKTHMGHFSGARVNIYFSFHFFVPLFCFGEARFLGRINPTSFCYWSVYTTTFLHLHSFQWGSITFSVEKTNSKEFTWLGQVVNMSWKVAVSGILSGAGQTCCIVKVCKIQRQLWGENSFWEPMEVPLVREQFTWSLIDRSRWEGRAC